MKSLSDTIESAKIFESGVEFGITPNINLYLGKDEDGWNIPIGAVVAHLKENERGMSANLIYAKSVDELNIPNKAKKDLYKTRKGGDVVGNTYYVDGQEWYVVLF